MNQKQAGSNSASPSVGLSERRVLHAKGMRAGLRLLLDDPALDAHPHARTVVHDHFDRCEAMIAGLEAPPEPPAETDGGPWEDEDPRHYAHRMGDRNV